MNVRLLLTMLLLAAAAARGEMRTFTSVKGGEIKAEILDATDTHAELKRADGKKFSVPLATLSEADRQWIAQWRKTHRHFKVQVSAAVKKGNSREVDGDAFVKEKTTGNDCWYALTFKNTGREVLAGLRVEYILFAPANAGGGSLCGAADAAAVAPGKSGEVLTAKLFVPRTRTEMRSGNAGIVQFTESSLAGIRAELLVDGKPAGTFISGRVPDDAEAQLAKWRESKP